MPLDWPGFRLGLFILIMSAFCKRLSEAQWFSYFIFAIIIAAGVVVGLQTYRGFELENRELLNALDAIILGAALCHAERFVKIVIPRNCILRILRNA